MLASQPILSNSNQFQTSLCSIKIPETIEVVEAVSEYISSYRKSDKLIVTDGRNLAYLPTNDELLLDFSTRQLCASEPEDRKIKNNGMGEAIKYCAGNISKIFQVDRLCFLGSFIFNLNLLSLISIS
jgi:hypothetical protein